MTACPTINDTGFPRYASQGRCVIRVGTRDETVDMVVSTIRYRRYALLVFP